MYWWYTQVYCTHAVHTNVRMIHTSVSQTCCTHKCTGGTHKCIANMLYTQMYWWYTQVYCKHAVHTNVLVVHTSVSYTFCTHKCTGGTYDTRALHREINKMTEHMWVSFADRDLLPTSFHLLSTFLPFHLRRRRQRLEPLRLTHCKVVAGHLPVDLGCPHRFGRRRFGHPCRRCYGTAVSLATGVVDCNVNKNGHLSRWTWIYGNIFCNIHMNS